MQQQRVAAVQTLVAKVPVLLPVSTDKSYKRTVAFHRTCSEIRLKPLVLLLYLNTTFLCNVAGADRESL